MDFLKKQRKEHLFVTADTHFGHKNVIQYCNRPFSSIEEMDETIIRNWNSVVMPSDTVIHLGDFALGPKGSLAHYVEQLNGTILLMKGNHDRTASFWRQFDPKIKMLEYGYCLPAMTHGYSGIIFSHRPMELSQIPDGYVNLHGHIHSTPTNRKYNYPPHIDCGVDYWNFTPQSIKTILDTILSEENHTNT